MTKRTHVGLVVAMLVLFVGATISYAQETRRPAPTAVEGDLVSVDAKGKMLTVKSASGEEMQFVYTDTTEISGAQDSAAGLATLKEGKVTVHFTEDTQTKVRTATRIIVHPRK